MHNLIKKIKESDRFYEKFKKNIIQFPYSFYFFYNIRFNLSLLKNFIFINFINLFKKKIQINEILFSLVIKKIYKMHIFYIKKIIQRFIFKTTR